MQKIVQKLSDIRVIITVFCVIVSYLTNFLKIDYLVIFGVLTLGIMHGANDLSLLQNMLNLKIDPKEQRYPFLPHQHNQ